MPDVSRRRMNAVRLVLPLVLLAALSASACGGGSDDDLSAQLVNEGLALQADERPDEAARKYREALVHDPTNKFALFNLGVISQERGEVARAELEYSLALVSDPSFRPALFNLAIVVAQRDQEEAVTVYERLLEVAPNDGSAHLNLGFLLIDLERRSEGQEHLDRAVELDPSLEARASGVRGAPSPEPAADEEP